MATLPKASAKDLEKEKIEVERGVKKELLLSWRAPVRPFKKRDREFYSTAGAIAFLVMVVLFFLKEWVLIVTIIALLFLVYILSTTPPEEVEHRITNKGIETGGKNYVWNELGLFWFTKQWGETILNVSAPFQMPGRLMMLLGKEKEENLRKLLERFLEHEEMPPTMMEKAGNWLARKVPLEKTPEPPKK